MNINEMNVGLVQICLGRQHCLAQVLAIIHRDIGAFDLRGHVGGKELHEFVCICEPSERGLFWPNGSRLSEGRELFSNQSFVIRPELQAKPKKQGARNTPE